MPDSRPAPALTVVIPVRDEEQNITPLHEELADVLVRADIWYELILVDDGSKDGTIDRLREVQQRDPHIRVVRFTRNFGQTAAFGAGFALARGQFIATLDGDLQNDPADIPRLLALAQSHDVVCGWRKDRKDNLSRRVPSVVANWLIGLVSGIRIHDYGCSMKVFRASVVTPLTLRPGMHRYFPALASQLGGRVTEVIVNHRARKYGHSKYGLSRTFRVVADLVHLRGLMRAAVLPAAGLPPLYEIAEILDRDGVTSGPAGTPGQAASRTDFGEPRVGTPDRRLHY